MAPDICLDVLTPSDISFQDLEQGKVDMAINRFDRLPQTFHQASLWHMAALLATQPDLVATLPTELARLHQRDHGLCMRKPPFMIIPIELQMAWSPLLQHDAGHIWLRRLIVRIAREVSGGDR